MKILLINANRYKIPWPVIPYGLCCVAAALEEKKYDIRVLDLCFSKDCYRDMKSHIESYRPDVIGLSIRNIDNSSAYDPVFLLEETKNEITDPLNRLFDGPIVIGGASVGISGAEMLEYLDLEYAIRGDGEHAMIAFVRGIENNAALDNCAGLVIRKNNKIIQDNPPMRVADLNTLPYYNPNKYIDISKYRKWGYPLQIQTKRGCALKCTYCTYNRIEGTTYRLRNPQKIADQIEQLVKDTGINRVEFTDSTFNIPLGHCKDVLRALKEKKLDLTLRTMSLNPGAMDEELVELMVANGMREVDLGIESGSDVTLAGLGKNYTKEDVIRAGRLLHKRKIAVNWYLLVGAPGETAKTLQETFDTVNETASTWDLIITGIGLRLYNGSPLSTEMAAHNPGCTADNFLSPVAYVPEKMSLDEVKHMIKKNSFGRLYYFTWDGGDAFPSRFFMWFGTQLMRLVAPKQPIWRLGIFIRIICKYIGIRWIRRTIYRKRWG